MEKPFTLKVQETEQKIVEIINHSELPAYVLKIVLQNLYAQIETLENQEIIKYNELKKNKKKESD